MKYPALDVRGVDSDIVLAVVDDFAPSAVEELPDGVSIFFATASRRDAASDAVAAQFPASVLSRREVDDEDWARRSQAALTPITVGRITVTPPWFAHSAHVSESGPGSSSAPSDGLSIVITPSMGFGTGHHATTRLCLAALQTITLAGKTVLDVGTGSGVLAIAAARLGASETRGIDFDADAVASACENLEDNPEARNVVFETVDVRDATVLLADIVLANLTGASLVQAASTLRAAVAPGGRLVLSGILVHERDAVLAAFAPAEPCWSEDEAGWIGLILNPVATRKV
ncbi:MAG: 50S ribosomal protein L11 methyltransferase [Vicinamibacterales bacterium]